LTPSRKRRLFIRITTRNLVRPSVRLSRRRLNRAPTRFTDRGSSLSARIPILPAIHLISRVVFPAATGISSEVRLADPFGRTSSSFLAIIRVSAATLAAHLQTVYPPPSKEETSPLGPEPTLAIWARTSTIPARTK